MDYIVIAIAFFGTFIMLWRWLGDHAIIKHNAKDSKPVFPEKSKPVKFAR